MLLSGAAFFFVLGSEKKIKNLSLSAFFLLTLVNSGSKMTDKWEIVG